jgi:hypothetical protein
MNPHPVSSISPNKAAPALDPPPAEPDSDPPTSAQQPKAGYTHTELHRRNLPGCARPHIRQTSPAVVVAVSAAGTVAVASADAARYADEAPGDAGLAAGTVRQPDTAGSWGSRLGLGLVAAAVGVDMDTWAAAAGELGCCSCRADSAEVHAAACREADRTPG